LSSDAIEKKKKTKKKKKKKKASLSFSLFSSSFECLVVERISHEKKRE